MLAGIVDPSDVSLFLIGVVCLHCTVGILDLSDVFYFHSKTVVYNLYTAP